MTLEEFLSKLDTSCDEAAKKGVLKQAQWYNEYRPDAPACALGYALKAETTPCAVYALIALAFGEYEGNNYSLYTNVRKFVVGFTNGFDGKEYHPEDFERLSGSTKNGYYLGRCLKERYIDNVNS